MSVFEICGYSKVHINIFLKSKCWKLILLLHKLLTNYGCLYYKSAHKISKSHKIVGIQMKLVHEISSRLETISTKLLWSWGTHKFVGVYLYTCTCIRKFLNLTPWVGTQHVGT